MRWIPYRFRPSFGFIWLLLVTTALVVLLGWGLREPDLDVVWRIEHGLRQGEQVVLSEAEQAALERAVARHPDLELAVDDQGRAIEVEEDDDEEDGE